MREAKDKRLPTGLRVLASITTAAAIGFTGAAVADTGEAKIRINVRDGMGTDHPIVTTLSAGQEVDILEYAGEFVRVRTSGGSEGYLKQRYLNVTKDMVTAAEPAPAPAPAPAPMAAPQPAPAPVAQAPVAAPAPAEDASGGDDAVALDRIQVTGSRISRADIEGALPVTVISRDDIERSGKTSVSEALRSLSFNSSGSYVQTSGNSFTGQAQVNLRGLGAERSIILVNGRRLPISPVSTSAADLNAIPLAAVERIEVLSDGASAVYGADAIGGVVNVILRKDFEGSAVSFGAGSPSENGGDTREASYVTGISTGKSNAILGGSYYRKDLIPLSARPYSRSEFGDGQDFGTTGGLSGYGNSVFSADFSRQLDAPDAACPEDRGFYRYTDDGSFNLAGGPLCTYDYTGIAADTASLEAASLFAYSERQINDTWSTSFDATYSQTQSFGRFAPAPALLSVPAAAPSNPYGEDIFIAHRYLALGPRDTEVQNDIVHVVGTLKGDFANYSAEAGLRLFRYSSNEFGRNYVLNSVAAANAASGAYNPLDVNNPGAPEVLNSMKVTINRDGYSEAREAFANFDFPMVAETGAGPVGLAVGGEYREEEFADVYDSQSEAGTVGGSAGNSSSGERDFFALYAETLVPLAEGLEMGLAVRFDDYSDVGSEFSPKVSFRYNPMDNLTVRASYGQGFRAPLLSELNANDSFSAETVRDLVVCDANGQDLTTCPQVQKDTYFVANNNLDPETSDQFSLGVVFQPTDFWDISLDYYNIVINDSISTPSPQSLVLRELAGQALPDGSSITRLASGAIDSITSQTVNIAEIKTDGLDLNTNVSLNLGQWGRLKSGITLSWVLGFTEDDGATPVQDQVGYARIGSSSAVPEYRGTWQTMWAVSDYTVTWVVSHIADTALTQLPSAANPLLLEKVGHTPSYTLHDLQVQYATPWDSDISLGVRDLFDRGANVNRSLGNPFYDQELYDPTGRMPYVKFTQRF